MKAEGFGILGNAFYAKATDAGYGCHSSFHRPKRTETSFPHDKDYIFRVADYLYLRRDRRLQYLIIYNVRQRLAKDRSQWKARCCDSADLGAVPDGVRYLPCIEVAGDDVLKV